MITTTIKGFSPWKPSLSWFGKSENCQALQYEIDTLTNHGFSIFSDQENDDNYKIEITMKVSKLRKKKR